MITVESRNILTAVGINSLIGLLTFMSLIRGAVRERQHWSFYLTGVKYRHRSDYLSSVEGKGFVKTYYETKKGDVMAQIIFALIFGFFLLYKLYIGRSGRSCFSI
jgi:hypothetical protein